jgi:hypothetical protein
MLPALGALCSLLLCTQCRLLGLFLAGKAFRLGASQAHHCLHAITSNSVVDAGPNTDPTTVQQLRSYLHAVLNLSFHGITHVFEEGCAYEVWANPA